ncbi:hypothetical protein O0I10_008008 [Lichtheimia ornata]|uniref:Uncharacterized protein n=1 Tax=Lichtheimia ornata TaxID=688661 RepID=A0AAD7UYZ7_9FUNG|nr:uncharacterized protein O0I10_008008 [Lichtheimia ornata]KAJ8656214.1 hypothetical protein O0I10_008008 [Lichtheimia ornata]
MEFSNAVDRLHIALKQIFERKAKKNPQKKSWSTASLIPWSWVAVSLAKLHTEYATGLTDTIALGQLELQWENAFFKYTKGLSTNYSTIQAVYDYRQPVALEVVVKEWKLIPGSEIYLVTVADNISYMVLDMYMHPKFNQWLSQARPSLQNKDPLLRNRTLRMYCEPKINAPQQSHYNNKDVDRLLRVARVPPTQLLMFVLEPRDASFIRQEFTEDLRNVIQHAHQPEPKAHKLWLKIIHIERQEHVAPNAGDGEESKLRRTDIFVVDMTNDNDPAVLSLYDTQTQLAGMLGRGDYIGLFNPGFPYARTESQQSRSDIVFEYTEDTVLFYMSDKDALQAGVHKVEHDGSISNSFNDSANDLWKQLGSSSKIGIMERDEEGFMDCATYHDRIYIQDLQPCMLNITILGRVIANPFYKDPEKKTRMDRYAMRIKDSTGKTDVTLWEQTGRSARKLQPGHYVLLTGLSTSNLHKGPKGPIWFINGSVMCGTQVYNISKIKALLSSSCLRSVMPLDALGAEGQWQVDILVTGWTLRTQKHVLLSNENDEWRRRDTPADVVIYDAHSACRQPIQIRNGDSGSGKKQQRVCEFCKCPVPESRIIQAFRSKPSVATTTQDDIGWIEWQLDDGGDRTIMSYGCDEDFLGVSAEKFNRMSHEEQIALLDSVLGRPMLCSISTTGHNNYRIDQVAPRNPTSHECIEAMAAITTTTTTTRSINDIAL